MSRKRTTALSFSVFTLAMSFCVAGCSSGNQAQQESRPVIAEQPVKPATPPPSPILPLQTATNPLSAKEVPKPSPPKPEDVTAVLARVYKKAVTPDTSREPAFLLGDFNGDGSQDLAILVRPNEARLGDINNELANWILEDPKTVPIPGLPVGGRSSGPGRPVRAEKGDILLAIVHGVGAQGWRSPEAKQTFLLKNSAGNGMSAQTAKDLLNSKDRNKLPPLRGDAIQEAIGGKSGLVFWTGAKYSWYSPSIDLQ
jgi:hypothetical protein